MFFIAFLILSACCCNVVLLEILIRRDPGCGNLITFSQFLTIAIEGFLFAIDCGRKKPHVPLRNYVFLVTLFFVVSVTNNYALNFDISMPLHMIFKSGSLVANLIMGMIILKRRYKMNKYVSVVMVTVGIIIATLASESLKAMEKRPNHQHSYASSLIGITLLTSALIVSAGLGIYQEMLFKKYGKHPREALFYSHALPLPGFLLLAKDIYSHSKIFSASEPVLPVSIPVMWLCLLGNVITQYICVRSVFVLSTQYTSLTVTMVITLRKFISLIFSILYFKNPFTAAHWAGTVLVFSGTLLFADIPNAVYQRLKKKTD